MQSRAMWGQSFPQVASEERLGKPSLLFGNKDMAVCLWSLRLLEVHML